jgi:tetratricopeptide (TPR) repeat protein
MKRAAGVIGIVVALALLSVSCRKSPQAREAKFLDSGKSHMQDKQYGRAILDFKNAAQAMPKDAEPYYQMGLAYLGNGDVKTAFACFRKATDLNPKHTAAQVKMSEIMAALGDKGAVQEAAKRASEVIAKGADAEAFDALALAQYRLGNREDAEKVLDQALEKFPTSLSSSVELAKVRLARNDLKGAEQALLQAVSNDPKSAHPHVALGALYLAERQLPQAEQQFRAALNIDPKSGQSLLNLGAIEIHDGHLDDADRIFTKLSALPDKQYKPAHAIFLFRTGKRDAAIAEFEKLAAADPSDRQAEARLVSAYMSVNRSADAERVLSAGLKKNPKDVDALLLRSRVYLATGKPDAAKADLTTAVGYRNESPDAHYLLARVYGIKGNLAEEQQEFGEALRLNPSYVPARLALAQSLLRSNQAQSAVNVLNDSPKQQQNLPALVTERAWALLASGETAEARVAIDPVLAAGRPPEALMVDATIRFVSKDYSGARNSAEEVLKAKPDELRALSLLYRTYAMQKQIPAGVQAVRSWAAKSPKAAPVQNMLGEVLLSTNDRAAAHDAFAAAIAADPNYRPALLAMAQLDIQGGNADKARPVLQRMAAGGDSMAELILGDLEFRNGNLDAATTDYRKVLDKDPNNIAALNNLAFLLIDHSHAVDEGLKFAQKAQQLAPESNSTNDTLGWAYFKKGDYTNALTYLARGADKNPTPVEKYHLAIAYIKSGNSTKGQQLLQAALKADPKLSDNDRVSTDLR